MKKLALAALPGLFFFVLARVAGAESLGTSARQLPPGSLRWLTYYQAVEDQALKFSVQGNGVCTAAGGIIFSCGQGANADSLGSGRAAMAKLVYQPWESFQYYASVGVADYDVKVPSATVSNLLTGDNPGHRETAGVKWVFYPDTIVTPALAIDASLTHARHYFNRRAQSGSPGLVDSVTQRLDLLESQVAVETSHLFVLPQNVKLEPYGGVKWGYVWADLKDLTTGGHAAGGKNSVRPFFGLRVPIFEHEQLFAEAAFIDGTYYATGLEIRFK